MPSHWTYSTFEPDSDLEQGDFLAPTEGLGQVLRKVHPHFADAKYLGFMVLSQSCDLVRRKSAPAAQYIAISPVRALDSVLPKLLSSVAREVAPGLFRASSKEVARQLLERIIDQNEQKLGLFYLHPDGDLELGESAVCFLRVSVSLRAEHYDKLLGARRGRLKPEFGNKLGWLTGNLYSRTATADWADQGGKNAGKDLIKEFLAPPGRPSRWVDDSVADAATKALTSTMTQEQALEVLSTFQPQVPVNSAVDSVLRVLKGLLSGSEHELPAPVAEKLRNKLLNDSEFRKQIRKSPGGDW